MSMIQRFRSVAVRAATRATASRISSSSAVLATRSFATVKTPEGEDLHLTGRQYELALLGSFPDAPTVQPFGTLERPALIYSGGASRIVGCIGGHDVKHKLLWFNLKEGKKHVCRQCGQVFQLVNDNNFEKFKHLVDERTRAHYEYYGTLKVEKGQVPDSTTVVTGPHSAF